MKKTVTPRGLVSILSVFLTLGHAPLSTASTPADASEATQAINRELKQTLPMQDKRSFDDAQRGLIEAFGDKEVKDASGRVIWSLKGYSFLEREDAPDTVNPALWRHARVNMSNGLYKVMDRVYQVRGLDVSNMTIMEGDSGLIVIDPLISTEVAEEAMKLYFKHRPRKPVKAVIYSHTHGDHFGGVRGVVNEADVAAGKVSIWAPQGFMEEAVGENVIVGNVMSRRAQYQFGFFLPRGERGQVDTGLGKTISIGTVTLIPPTHLIKQGVEKHRIDGIDIVFELTPGAEAPVEFIMYHPQFKLLNMTEITSTNFHNLLPMRGALVRDSLAWSKYIGGALQRYGDKSDILIAQHNWPVWGGARIQDFLSKQRDAYKFLHDQTVRLMNHGYVGSEIADMVKMPPSLVSEWSTHFFYGHMKHNIKAIYQRYLGYYDGNPANLEGLPPVEFARRSIEYMGGAEAVLKRAQADFDRAEYRWVAQVASQLVFADPGNQEARELAARALEQLGYQTESATARNAMLMGAHELRNGMPKIPGITTASPDMVRAMSLDQFFDYLGIRLNAEKAQGKEMVLNWNFTDTRQKYVLNLENSALTAQPGAQKAHADATVTLTRQTLDEISLQKTTFADALKAGRITVSGDQGKLVELLGMLDTFPRMFPMVEPRPAPAK